MNSSPKPNLFLIGAMKSGTSSLHAYLNNHPEIYMSEEKEPGYFLDEFTREKGLDWYLSLFSAAGNARIIGESSTHYTKLPHFRNAAGRIYDFDPDAKLIYIMRDPVERTISHYWHAVYSHNERRPILEAIKEDRRYRDVSHYAMQIAPYFELFRKQQIYTLTFEELISAPAESLRDIYTWLGLEPTFEPRNINKGYNVGARKFVKPGRLGFLNKLRFTKFWEIASHAVPKPVKTLARKLAEKEFDRSEQPTGPVIEYLRPIQINETKTLSARLGRSFPEWKTLYGA